MKIEALVRAEAVHRNAYVDPAVFRTLTRANVGAQSASKQIQGLLARLNAWAANETLDSNDLLELAKTYEATQPSYAADLRAAATLQPLA